MIVKYKLYLRTHLSIQKSICKEHQDQIDEFLAGDKQLKAEIEYDIRRYEIREKAERLAAKRTVKEVSEPLQNSHCPVSVIHQRIEEKQVGDVIINRSCETTISCLIKKELQEKANDLKQIDAQSNSVVCHQPIDNISHSNGTLPVQKIPKVTKQLDSENIGEKILIWALYSFRCNLLVYFQRTRSNICGRSIADESVIDGRAISTPKKGIVNVTFTDLNLSAISYSSEEGNNQLQRRSAYPMRSMLGIRLGTHCRVVGSTSAFLTHSCTADTRRMSHTIWYPDAKFERQFKTGGTLGKLWMSDRITEYDQQIGLDKFEKLAYQEPVMSDTYEGKHR
uniref:Tubulin-specific chaperone A n=1 Tax=Heterorhabditis bacteriophora TaxID=37862 RepID=A0A1I7W6V8_HETBA